MADSVTYDRGNAPTAGNPSTGYQSIEFKWNTGSGTSHAALTSDSFSMFKEDWTIQLNANAIAVANNMLYDLIGSNDEEVAEAKWESIQSATIMNAGITEQIVGVNICHTGVGNHPRFKHYRLKLDPSANPGSDIVFKVNLIPGRH